jgi:hypothetical protein
MVTGSSKPLSSASTNAGTSTTGASCARPGPGIDLGAVAFDAAPSRFVSVTAGRYQLTATGLLHGGLLDPNVGRTAVVWGPTTSLPTYSPGPATVSGGVGRAVVVEGAGTWVDLPDGTFWFVNSYGARLTPSPCAPASATVVPS